jgi:hypothetical protein
MPSDEFADILGEHRTMLRSQLEEIAARPVGNSPPNVVGFAKAELLRRDREYAEQEEQSRREWETKHQAARQVFEEKLTKRQMDHAAAIAKKQLDTARGAKWAAISAAIAAFLSAAGAIGQVIIAITK